MRESLKLRENVCSWINCSKEYAKPQQLIQSTCEYKEEYSKLVRKTL